MPTPILNDPNWVRTAEILYRGQEFTGLPLDPTYTIAANPILPGQVVVAVNGRIKIADQALDGGAFLGLMFSEYSARLDETDKKSINPVVIRGPATCKVLNASLDVGSTYALSASAVVELVVGTTTAAGKLIPRTGTGPTVATLQEVLSDGIVIQLGQPDQEITA